MSFVAAATAIGFTGVGATIAAGAMMGGATTVAGNVIGGRDPLDNIGRGLITGGITGGLTPGFSEMTGFSVPASAGIIQGGLTTLATGDIGQGLMAGMGAYGAYGLAESMSGMGTGILGQRASEATAMELMNAGAGEGLTGTAYDQAFQKSVTDKMAAITPGTKMSASLDGLKANPSGFLKDNFKYITAAAAPILADQAVKSNNPQTVTQPGMIRPYSYDPYSGAYTAGNPYEVTPTKAAGGGLMGMNNGGYSPGELNFAQRSEPVVRMAEGGSTVRMAKGTPPKMLTDEQLYQSSGLTGQAGWEAAAKARDAQNAAMNTYNLTDNAAVGANINKWITDNPFATTTDINNAIKTSGLTQDLVNPYLTANTNISNATRYALSHASEMPGAGGLAGLNANILKEFAKNPGMNQTSIDTLQDIYKVSDADIQRPLSHGSQVAAADIGKAANYLATNPDVQAWINSAEGRDYMLKNPSFDASDIAFTHYQRYGAGEGRKWEEAATKTALNCPAGYRPNAAGTACELIPVVSTCPAPDMRILLANGDLKAAGNLQVGDVIRTQHETTLAWGDHPVTHVSIVPNVPRLKIEFGDVKFVCSLDHKFFKAAGEWVTAKDVVLGDMLSGHTVRSLTQADVGDVVRITVDDAHTYICEGLLSHNKSPQAPVDATQSTSTNVTTPTSISTAASTALPVGISGAGITTINPNGTVTTRPDLGLEMSTVRNDYVRGGGNLGYTSPIFDSLKAVEDKYPLRGGSKQSYNYLTGKTDYDPVPYTKTGEIMKPYSESVLGIPMASSKRMYLFDPVTKTYKVNPEYAIPTYDSKGKKSYNLTNQDVINYVKSPEYSDDATFVSWMTANNLSPEQIAAATGMSIADVYKKIKKATPATTTTGNTNTTGATVSENDTRESGGDAAGGLMKLARGGMSQQFDLGGYSDGGRLLRGPGDGVSDSIPATIGNKRPARLADGEFVVPARIVSELGNGSTEAGARKLYAMMDRVQSARRGTVGKGRVAKNSRSDKYLPA